jgi:hypothetical protein
VGSELFNRTMLWARNRGIRRAILYCLYENQLHDVWTSREAGGQRRIVVENRQRRARLPRPVATRPPIRRRA